MKNRILRSKHILEIGRLKERDEPKPTAMYFKNIRRGPVGLVRKALIHSFPTWTLLGLSFIGGSVLEIITDVRLRNRLVATLNIMRI